MDKNLRIQIVLNAVGNAIRPIKALSLETTKAGKAIKEARARIRELEKQNLSITKFRKLKENTAQVSAQLKDARAKATALGKSFAATDSPTKALTSQFKKARDEVTKLEQRQRAEQTSLNALREQMNRTGLATGQLATHEQRIRRDIAGANHEIDQQKRKLSDLAAQQKRVSDAKAAYAKAKENGEQISSAGFKAVGVGTGLAAPLILATKASIEFEQHMANVRKIIDFPTPKAFDQFKGSLTDTGVKLGINPDGMADIAAQGAMGGVPRDELLKFSRDAALMKEALNFDDAKTAGEMAAGWRHAFNLRQDQVHELGDVITGLTRKWGAKGGTGAEVGQIVANVGTLGQVAGAGRKETAALAAVLSSMNIDSGVASTGIRNLMINLTRGAGAARNQQKAFAALGLDAKVMAQAMQKDAGGAIMLVLDKIHQLPKAQQTGVLSQLFGARSIGPIGSLLERFDRVKEALGFVGDAANYTGQMELEFKRKTDTTAFALEQAKGNAENLAIAVGDVLNPTVRRLASEISPVIQRVTAWAQAHPQLVRLMVISTAVTAGLLIIMGAFAIAIGAVIAPLALLRLKITESSSAMDLMGKALPKLGQVLPALGRGFIGLAESAGAASVALLTNPITWIVLAIVTAIAGIALAVRKFWGPISAFVSGFGHGLASAFSPLLATASPLTNLLGRVGAASQGAGAAMGGLWAWLVRLVEPVRLTKVQLASWTSLGQGVARPLVAFCGQAAKALGSLFAAIMNSPVAAWAKSLAGGIGKLTDYLMGDLREATAFLGGLFEGLIEGVAPFIALIAKLHPILGVIGRAAVAVGHALASLAVWFASAVWGDLVDVLQPIIAVLGAVIVALGIGAWLTLRAAIGGLAWAFGSLWSILLAIAKPLATTKAQLDGVAGVGQAVGSALGFMIGLFLTFRVGLALLTPFLKLGLGMFRLLGGAVGFFATKVLPLLMRVLPLVGRAIMGLAMTIGRAGLALLTNPITWVVVGIVAAVALLAGAAYLIWKNWKPITAWFAGVWDGIKVKLGQFIDWAGSVWKRFADFGGQMITGLISGVSGKMADLKKAITGMGDQVATWFKQRLGIHSPSRVFADLGGFTIDGFILGIDDGASRLADRVKALATHVGATMRKGLQGSGSWLAHAFHGAAAWAGRMLNGRGPLGLRLNNPGNLRRWGDNPTAHGFVAFKTMGDGFRAMARQLQLYAARDHRDTVASIVSRWAPPSENRTGAYIQAVSRRTGFAPGQHLNLGNAAVMASLVAAMAAQEQGRSFDPKQLQGMMAPPLHFDAPTPVRAAGGHGPLAMPDLHLHIHAAPGMDHKKLVEEAKQELRREFHALMKKHTTPTRPSKSSFDDIDGD